MQRGRELALPPSREVIPRGLLDLADVRGLQALRPTGDVELHALTLCQGLEPFALDRGEMDEHVLATFLGDEAKTLRLVEPLHSSTCHCTAPCLTRAFGARVLPPRCGRPRSGHFDRCLPCPGAS